MSKEWEFNKLLMREQVITDMFTMRGTHEGCGECCSRFLPLTAFEADRLRALRDDAVHVFEEGTIDLTCPFLDDDRRCAIYDSRPLICRAYDCSEHARYGAFAAAMRLPRAFKYELRDVCEVLA